MSFIAISKPHERIIRAKYEQTEGSPILGEIIRRYEIYVTNINQLDSEKPNELKQKVELLNEYKDYIDSKCATHFKLQDKIGSSVLEEFLFFLLKDIPEVESNLGKKLIVLGQAGAYMDMSFAPKDLKDFVRNANVHINKKNQDFTISKVVQCTFRNEAKNSKEEHIQFVVPTVAIECKTFIPSTMLGQSDYEAQKIKQGNPFSLYVVVAEQNALSDDIILKNSKIDEIFILRRQKRSKVKNPIDAIVMADLYSFIKAHLKRDWHNANEATQKGRLIRS